MPEVQQYSGRGLPKAQAESSSLFNWDGALSAPATSNTPTAMTEPSSRKNILGFATEKLSAHLIMNSSDGLQLGSYDRARRGRGRTDIHVTPVYPTR